MKKQLVAFFLLFFMLGAGAQNIKYVNTPVPFKEKGLVSTNIEGGIEDMVYVSSTSGYSQKSLRISSYNKETSVMIKTVAVKGFANRVENRLLTDARFDEIYVKNNLLYVVWKRNLKESTQLVLQVFDKDLIEVQSAKVIYQIPYKGNKYENLFFFISPNGSKMIAGVEESAAKSKDIKIQYKVMDMDQEVLNTVQAEMPYSLVSSSGQSVSDYKMDDDGFLYFMVDVNLNNETKESKKEVGSLIGSINPETSDLKTKVFSFSNKVIEIGI